MQRQQQESSLQQRLGFLQQYHKNHPNITELKPLKDYKTQLISKKPKELEEQPKLSLMENLNRINSLYKAVSQPRIDAKEVNPPQYFYNYKQVCQKPEIANTKAIKENQNIKTFLNNNSELSLKDYDWKSNKGNVNTTKSTSPMDFSTKSPLNKVTRTDSLLANKKTNEPVVTFLRGLC
ncbi:unnamed protein product [Paramecium sonneborni]|uniref:Uncharacterized protein n=1 Tax=Paramecium sonneborni TaxID=65129 RepID=A0A8S1PZR9_9CILI|nr:unnamed protein product [Paramecium sonneborni]